MAINSFGSSSSGISVPATATALVAVAMPTSQGSGVRVVNEGPSVVFIAIGASTVLATLPTTGTGAVTCTPVLVGEDVIFARNPYTDTFISTICRSAGTAVLTVQCGEGS